MIFIIAGSSSLTIYEVFPRLEIYDTSRYTVSTFANHLHAVMSMLTLIILPSFFLTDISHFLPLLLQLLNTIAHCFLHLVKGVKFIVNWFFAEL